MIGRSLFILLFSLAVSGRLDADAIDDAIAVLSRTGPQAAGSQDARSAAGELAQRGPEILPRLLDAMDTSNIVAANWNRTVFEQIVDREFSQKPQTPQFPREPIETFVRDPQRHGRPRRLALELLERIDPAIRSQMMPRWLDDPEFRTDAVAFVLSAGDIAQKSGQKDEAKKHFEVAFRHARESDQVLQSVARLKAVGVEVDPIEHMGFIHRWYLIGPFESPGMSGFANGFPPEVQVDLKGEYKEGGRSLKWFAHTTRDTLGQVNLIEALFPVKEAVGYAYAEIEVPKAGTAQLRCSADDNLTVWLNGSKVLAREQWLNGTRLDRFVVPVEVVSGRNRLLVKICQGPQHVNPEVPNNWTFQLRLCDPSGAAIGAKIVVPEDGK